jgi:hypothetical protein
MIAGAKAWLGELVSKGIVVNLSGAPAAFARHQLTVRTAPSARGFRRALA